jgi:hypothetical protein
MEVFTYEVKGVSPLLQHNPAAMGSGPKGLAAKKVYDTTKEADAGAYRNGDGQYIIPTIAFRSAILSASKGRKIGKVAARAVLAGCVFPIEESCLLLDAAKMKPFKAHEVHTCRAVVNKAGIIRARPMFRDWACKLALEIDTEMLPEVDIITQLLNIAGKIIGVMDWRPEKLGIYGRFTAALL